MRFYSTRDPQKTKYSSTAVIKQGLADDGGLFIPENIPQISKNDLLNFSKLSYPELAAEILSKFLTDYSYEELLFDAQKAYSETSFGKDPCPLHKMNGNTYSLELWHGPTCAFKDMALQIMPRLLSRALLKTDENKEALVVVATSGDTGKAALEGYKNVDRIRICVFYPENGVSSIQKLQMTTQDGENVHVCSIKGNFDDIQTGVKDIFADKMIANELEGKGYFLSSANSINFGRLAPQIVYYIKAYCDLLNQGEIAPDEEINVCVPTGNFGNILAAYIAKLMGLPLNRLICASNSNNILTDFLNTGAYDRNREFHTTISPSMDILISSNLERLLCFIAGEKKTAEWMKSLSESGSYTVDSETKRKINCIFKGGFANEEQTKTMIKKAYEEYNYLIDPHTAVAFYVLEDYRTAFCDDSKTVIASTASPYKFAKDVYASLKNSVPFDDLSALDELASLTNTKIPTPLASLKLKQANFDGSNTPENMYCEVSKLL